MNIFEQYKIYKQFQSMGYKGSYNDFLNNHEIVIAKPVPDIKKDLKELVSLIGEFKTLHKQFVKYYL